MVGTIKKQPCLFILDLFTYAQINATVKLTKTDEKTIRTILAGCKQLLTLLWIYYTDRMQR